MSSSQQSMGSENEQKAKVVVYTTDWCPYCIRVKRLLNARGYAFEEINVDSSEQRAWLAKVSGQRTVPQVFIDGKPVGGFNETSALDRAGDLAKMIRGNV